MWQSNARMPLFYHIQNDKTIPIKNYFFASLQLELKNMRLSFVKMLCVDLLEY